MVFSSHLFCFYFLPLALAVYYALVLFMPLGMIVAAGLWTALAVTVGALLLPAALHGLRHLAPSKNPNLRLAQDRAYDPDALEDPQARARLLRSAFSVLPDGPGSNLPRYKQTALWRLASPKFSSMF